VAKNFEKLKKLLEELFQLDQADLDFGIYRIMNQKRDEVVKFLEKDLLPQVKKAFSHYQSADKVGLQRELAKLVAQIEGAGMNPDDSPKVQELKEKMTDSSVDVTALENEVFSHLLNFFRRYYDEGDFISLRRYKEGVYAIPYEGEEVKLHWANHDQYYIKSSEYFRDYIFTMPSGKRVRVHLVAASSEQDNKKEQVGKERRFVICNEDPIYEENGELFIRFEYKPDSGKKKQDSLNQEAIKKVLQSEGYEDWVRELSKLAPTKANPKRTVFEKHLTQYTARNTFDYFIHKDLGGFLRRELDFYIKNEVMHLDDIEHDTVPRVEQYLSKIKVIRKIAHKIIQFLEQLENFQKKMWLKKKFVVETSYCMTLDRIPEHLYDRIAANEDQRKDWVQLFEIDKIEKDPPALSYSCPLTTEFLKDNRNLLVDTRHFDAEFTEEILRSTDALKLDGLLVCGENFHAMQLLRPSLEGKVKCVYADPPYNTDGSPILYKNGFKNSSWISFINDRIALSHHLLSEEGVLCATIDDSQQKELHSCIESVFGKEHLAGTVVIRSNPSGLPKPSGLGVAHEYAIFATKSKKANLSKLPRSEQQLSRYREIDDRGRYMWELFRKRGSGSRRSDRPTLYYPLFAKKDGSIRIPRMHWEATSKDWVLDESPSAGESTMYPIDGEGVERRWRWKPESVERDLTQFLVKENRDGETIVYYKYRPSTDGVLPLTVWADAKYSATEHGTGTLKKLFQEYNVFDFPKSVHAVDDCLHVSGLDGPNICLDPFAGSGTTGHSVLNLNRRDGGNRTFVLLEMGEHFDSVLKPRILKVMYCAEWNDGTPASRSFETSHAFKYVRLESYEDALSNLRMNRTDQQASLLDDDDELHEQYILSYMLDVESRGSQSLLNVDGFRNPNEYKLKVERNGETQLVNVDLVETFNWLLGLTVKHIDVIRGVRVVEGTNPENERVVVLWRNLDEIDSDSLDAWFKKQDYNTKDQEYDVIYVNGDNNLENLRRGDQTWKVRLIEEEFGRLMFDVEDV